MEINRFLVRRSDERFITLNVLNRPDEDETKNGDEMGSIGPNLDADDNSFRSDSSSSSSDDEYGFILNLTAILI